MIECGTCDGEGKLVVEWTEGDYLSPPEPKMRLDCPVCDGCGEVEPELFEEMEGEFPDYEEGVARAITLLREA